MSFFKKAPMAGRKPSAKIPGTRLLAAAAVLLLALGAAYYLYDSAFPVPRDEARLSEAITSLHGDSEVVEADAEILELRDVEDVLVAFYRERQGPQVFGFAIFEKGWNQKHRLVSTSYRDTSFSSVVQAYVLDYKGLKYYVVGGFQVDEAIRSYGLNYQEVRFSRDVEEMHVRFDVPGEQFLQVHKASETDREILERQGEWDYRINAHEVSLFNSLGNNVTEAYLVAGMPRGSFAGGGNIGGIGDTYFLILFILGAAGVYIRYALLESGPGRPDGFPEERDKGKQRSPQATVELPV